MNMLVQPVPAVCAVLSHLLTIIFLLSTEKRDLSDEQKLVEGGCQEQEGVQNYGEDPGTTS